MSIIYNALSGSQAAQVALTATSQNIANAKTDGYSRQGALLAAIGPRGDMHSPGSGVEVSSLMRFSDSYKVHQMWNAASDLGQHSTQQPYLSQLEQVMGDDSSSISNGLDGFFAALNAATLDPASTPLRQQVIGAANTLGARFNSLNSLLLNQQTSVQQQMGAVVSQVNLLTKDIGGLNDQIASLQATGGNASALMDTRDQRINTLAGLVGVNVVDQPDGTLSVSLRNGQPLVIGATASTMSLPSNGTGAPTLNVQFANQTFTSTGANLGGQLGGIADFLQNTLMPLQQSISNMASTVAASVNGQLAQGVDMNGNPGAALFQYDSSSANGLLTITPGIQADQLAFAAAPPPPPPPPAPIPALAVGDNTNLQALIALKNISVAPLPATPPATPLSSPIDGIPLGDANSQLLGQLGMTSQQNQSLLATAQTVSDQAKSNWATTSGVNTDEEAVNLMEYQQMYQANMKVIAVANQLFDSTLQMMG